MKDLDAALREALQRREPPPGFAERVLARTQARPTRRWQTWGALAASVALTFGVWSYERQQRQHQQEEAARQTLLALHITQAELAKVRAKLQSIGGAEIRLQAD